MAVMSNANPEYYALKKRLDWCVPIYFSPIIILPLFVFLQGSLKLWQVWGAISVIFVSLLVTAIISLYLHYRIIGFWLESPEQCERCSHPLAESYFSAIPRLYYLCPRCGNNNAFRLQ
jgi:hypothetical protein